MEYEKEVDGKVEKRFSTGLWKQVSAKGTIYLSGKYNNYRVCFFHNLDIDSPEDHKPVGFLKLYPLDKLSEAISVNMYVRISKKGDKYITGARGYRFNIFVNKKKAEFSNPRMPDYNLLISEINKKLEIKEGSRNPKMPDNPVENPGQVDWPSAGRIPEPLQQTSEIEVDDDDIPF